VSDLHDESLAFPPNLAVDEPEVEEAPQVLETKRVIRHRAELYTRLAKTGAFQELMKEGERHTARKRKNFADRLLLGEPLDQRVIDEDRGFLAGLAYYGEVIKGAERTLKELDREAAERAESQSEPEAGGVW
jgi:hypothetical protein